MAETHGGRLRGSIPSLGYFRSRIRNSSLQSWSERIEVRQHLVAFCFLLAFAVVAGKIALVSWSEPHEPRTTWSGSSQLSQRAPIIDRNGVVLAINLPTFALYAHPHEMSPGRGARSAADKLAEVFGELDADRLYRRFTDGRKFLWIKQRMTPEQEQMVHDIGEPGLYLGTRETRVYPNGRLAAHILGGTSYGEQGVHAAEVIGTAGIERAEDAFLRDPANDGLPLELSIDAKVQAIVREKLYYATQVFQAKRASAVLMDAHNGEILALASIPDFDPNNRKDNFEQGSGQKNPLFCDAIQGVFELGSTFKIFAAVQALELGLANLDTPISNEWLQVGKYVIKGTERGDPTLSLKDVITKSSNSATARLALSIGGAKQKQFLASLGLLEPTELEVAEASLAKPLVPERWNNLETATISYGHGIAVSLVHLAAAYSALVNGGFRVTPTILKGKYDGTDRLRVISEANSRKAVEMLRSVVTDGTARQANMPAYSVGGKTGTADKPKPHGGYYPEKVLATFVAAFPTEDVRYVLVVSLDEGTSGDGTKWARSAGKTAVPTAAIIIGKVAPLLGIRPADRTADTAGN